MNSGNLVGSGELGSLVTVRGPLNLSFLKHKESATWVFYIQLLHRLTDPTYEEAEICKEEQ